MAPATRDVAEFEEAVDNESTKKHANGNDSNDFDVTTARIPRTAYRHRRSNRGRITCREGITIVSCTMSSNQYVSGAEKIENYSPISLAWHQSRRDGRRMSLRWPLAVNRPEKVRSQVDVLATRQRDALAESQYGPGVYTRDNSPRSAEYTHPGEQMSETERLID